MVQVVATLATFCPATYVSSTAIPKIGKTYPLTTTLLRQAVRFVREYTNKYSTVDNLSFFVGWHCLGSYNELFAKICASTSPGVGRLSAGTKPWLGFSRCRKADQKISRSMLGLKPKTCTFISTS